jgi:hypothetical protein
MVITVREEEWDGDGGGGVGLRQRRQRRSGTTRLSGATVKAGRMAVTAWTRRRRQCGGGRRGGGIEEEGAGNFGSLTASKSKSSG